MDTDFRQRVLNRIRDRIAMLDVQSGAIEEALGITQPSASRLRKGVMLPDADKLPALARLLGTSCDYLLCNTDDPAPVDTSKFPTRFAFADKVLESVIEATAAMREAIMAEDAEQASGGDEQNDATPESLAALLHSERDEEDGEEEEPEANDGKG